MSEAEQATPGSVQRPIRVVLVNPPTGALAQIHHLLSNEADIEVFVHAEGADPALEAMRRLPHRLGVVALVTLGLEGEHDSFWLIRSIREMYPTLPVLACGTEIDDATISWALFTGADGFVALEVEPAEFVSALRRVAQRELTLEGLPSCWMAREDVAAPVIVLPAASGPADEQRKRMDSSTPDDLTLVLPGGDPEAGPATEDALSADPQGSTHPRGSRIGRLFVRRHRRAQPPLPDAEPLPDSGELG